MSLFCGRPRGGIFPPFYNQSLKKKKKKKQKTTGKRSKTKQRRKEKEEKKERRKVYLPERVFLFHDSKNEAKRGRS